MKLKWTVCNNEDSPFGSNGGDAVFVFEEQPTKQKEREISDAILSFVIKLLKDEKLVKEKDYHYYNKTKRRKHAERR